LLTLQLLQRFRTYLLIENKITTLMVRQRIILILCFDEPSTIHYRPDSNRISAFQVFCINSFFSRICSVFRNNDRILPNVFLKNLSVSNTSSLNDKEVQRNTFKIGCNWLLPDDIFKSIDSVFCLKMLFLCETIFMHHMHHILYDNMHHT